jgi:lauroyl/myristoyl acyltransferase
MAHVFYADKKAEHITLEPTQLKSRSRSKKSTQKGEIDQSWGKTFELVWKIIAWFERLRLYRANQWKPSEFATAWGHLLGKIAFGRNERTKKKVVASVKAFYPHISQKRAEKIYDAWGKYMGTLISSFFGAVPMSIYVDSSRMGKYFQFTNIEKLHEALDQKKGVILPIVHVGLFFQIFGAHIQLPDRINVGTIASIPNLIMYEMLNQPRYTNMYFYASTGFSRITTQLEKHLLQNHVLIIMHDFSSPSQLRVPVLQGKFPYLINTPQSYINLHKKTGAIILPCMGIPMGAYGKTQITYLDNSAIMNASRKYWDAPDKEFHGRISTEINKLLYSEVRKYMHLWEEIVNLDIMRLTHKIRFPPNISMKDFLTSVENELLKVLENSWEPDRPDAVLRKEIELRWPKAIATLKQPTAILRPHKTKITLARLNGTSELRKLTQVAIRECTLKTESATRELLSDFLTGLH